MFNIYVSPIPLLFKQKVMVTVAIPCSTSPNMVVWHIENWLKFLYFADDIFKRCSWKNIFVF